MCVLLALVSWPIYTYKREREQRAMKGMSKELEGPPVLFVFF